MNSPKLSVVINTKNVAETIKKTLKSVSFADEIVIVDMHSTDKTVSLAKKFTKKIFQHKDLGYADPARNFALKKASHEWILVVDADEVVTPSLKKIILETIAQEKTADVYWLPRKNMIFGQWIQHTGWWPDYQPRLFKKGKVSWQRGVHRLPDVTGETRHFPAEERYTLLHHNYTDVTHFLQKLNSYTSIQATERAQKSPRKNFSSEEMLTIFAEEFARRAMTMNGIKDGLHGLSLSLLQAMYEAVIYLKQWGNEGYSPVSAADFESNLQKMQQIWRYWWADYQVRKTRGIKRLYWRVRRKYKV